MTDELMRFLEMQGADLCGTSNIKGLQPAQFSALPFAITIGIRLSDAVVDAVTQGPTKLYFAHYRAVNALLDMTATKCVGWLQRRGFNALAIPASQTTSESGISADFPHKTAANMAGLGFVGKSALFISSAFGPRVRLATVLTDMPLPAGEMQPAQCGDCRVCVDACPCGALTGRAWSVSAAREDIVDAQLCSRHMKKVYQHIGRGAVCGICMAVCPFGKRGKSSLMTLE
jgi:epoxyqueuosine reductase QueG